jgi:hypothetical protein
MISLKLWFAQKEDIIFNWWSMPQEWWGDDTFDTPFSGKFAWLLETVKHLSRYINNFFVTFNNFFHIVREIETSLVPEYILSITMIIMFLRSQLFKISLVMSLIIILFLHLSNVFIQISYIKKYRCYVIFFFFFYLLLVLALEFG